MDSSSSPCATPKRKRDQEVHLTPIKFSFDLSKLPSSSDEGGGSPHTKVAHEFRGLALDTKGGVVSSGAVTPYSPTDEHTALSSKRRRADEGIEGAPARVTVFDEHGNNIPQPEAVAQSVESLPGEGSLHRGYPSINRLSESKSRGRRRTGTPPLRLRKGPVHDVADDDDEDEADEEMEIVDPVRASLTWHEHEITVYDPEDEDDDGTGINGIGFKPTPALAHARALKRKQQMDEYKRREDMEARARRSERRGRGSPVGIVPGEGETEAEKESRRVRFEVEAENQAQHTQALTT